MPRELIQSAVVLGAQNFNPTVTDQLWLVRNEIVREEEFLRGGCMFSDMVVQVPTQRFVLLITPQQVQFVVGPPEEEQQDLILERLGRLVRELPHTPYKALGLNFTWHLVSRPGRPELSRELFFRADSPVFRDFDAPEAKFGGYLSRDVLGFRLKLDIKPVTVMASTMANPEDRLQFLFNFHADLPRGGRPVERIDELLRRWNEAAALSRRIMESVPDGREG